MVYDFFAQQASSSMNQAISIEKELAYYFWQYNLSIYDTVEYLSIQSSCIPVRCAVVEVSRAVQLVS
jgi:hypothetical protein